MARCEDFPCCGCGPEGCVDFERTVNCQDCGDSFHPDSTHEKFCLVCGSKPAVREVKTSPVAKETKCISFDDCEEMAVCDLDGVGPVCAECHDEIVGEWQADFYDPRLDI